MNSKVHCNEINKNAKYIEARRIHPPPTCAKNSKTYLLIQGVQLQPRPQLHAKVRKEISEVQEEKKRRGLIERYEVLAEKRLSRERDWGGGVAPA